MPISQPVTARSIGQIGSGASSAAATPTSTATRSRGRAWNGHGKCRGRGRGGGAAALARAKPEPRYFDRRAAVHDDLEALRLGALGGGRVAHVELHPPPLGPDREAPAAAGPRRLAAPEDVDHVDAFRDLG